MKKWAGTNSGMGSMNSWRNNLNNLKNKNKNRYNYVVKNLKSAFNLSASDYNKYFGDL